MPIDLLDTLKLIIGIIIIIIPGYLWSYLFSKQISRLERIVFGFILGIILLSVTPYVANVFFHIVLSRNVILVIFLLYTIPAVLIFSYRWYASGIHHFMIPRFFTWKNLLLFVLLGFIVFMTFLPHLSNNYYLPFHVDEWVHWSYTRSVMDYGSVSFPYPYTGGPGSPDLEIGFHLFTASVSWLTSSSLLTLFLYMPSMIAVFLGLTAFCIGERSERKFGFEACLLVSLIPTTTRYLGLSFYVSIALGLLFLVFLLRLIQQKQNFFLLLIPPVLWCLFLVHPVTAFAGIIVVSIYCIMLFVEKNTKFAFFTGVSLVLTCIPFLILLTIPSRWESAINAYFNALMDKQTVLTPAIYVNFNDLGIITWVLFIIGIYYVITKGKSLQLTACFSTIAFIMIIGLFSLFGYGASIIYERSFLYLFLFVSVVAAIGLREFREALPLFIERRQPHRFTRHTKYLQQMVIPLVLVVLVLITVVPTHLETPYYEMISEKDYETFTWIRDNINFYRDTNHSYYLAAVDPSKASPFSAVTGLYIFTSNMHPLVREWYSDRMESFLADQCRDTAFLTKFGITVIYGSCENSNLTMIHPNVYLFTNPPSR